MGFLAIRTWLFFRNHKRALDELEKTPEYEISDLPSLLRDKKRAKSLSSPDATLSEDGHSATPSDRKSRAGSYYSPFSSQRNPPSATPALSRGLGEADILPASPPTAQDEPDLPSLPSTSSSQPSPPSPSATSPSSSRVSFPRGSNGAVARTSVTSPSKGGLLSFFHWFGEGRKAREQQQLARSLSSPPSSPPRLIMVKGMVQARDPRSGRVSGELIRAEHSSERGVVHEKTQTCIYAELKHPLRLALLNKAERVSMARSSVPFGLVDASQRPKVAPFVWLSMEGAHQPLPLTRVYSRMQNAELTWKGSALHLLFAQRLPLGVLEEERLLKPGTELTAVGRLESNQEGAPVVKAAAHLPVFLTRLPRKELLLNMVHESQWYLGASLLFSTVAIGILSFSLHKNWRRWKSHFQRIFRRQPALDAAAASTRQRNEAALVDEDNENIGTTNNSSGTGVSARPGASTDSGDPLVTNGSSELPSASASAPSSVGDGELCVVCFTRRRRAVFLHCGHRVCCATCARCIRDSAQPRCPICREAVDSVYRVFDA
eukprot:TRINITY_DN589_c0_g2_i1.p1 TRINITY_DN589_c0_g2~~TRINITY_DN589_c0_g2_i1.p1  ORF type:complete len:557 (+),score=80.73 TRINITY_DN589_c0_g2_i1:34-1671(+)